MSAPTPGPWHATLGQTTPLGEIWHVDREGETMGFIATLWSEAGASEANARLVAAAPETAAERDRLREVNAEMLKALKYWAPLIAGHFEGTSDEMDERVDALRAAIARAEGRS